MALAYRTSVVAGNTTSGTNPSVAITPAVGDLFVVFCQATGNTNVAPTCSDGNTGGTYTLIATAQSNSSGNTLSCFIRNNLLANTTSTTVTVACGAHTAVEISVVAISGALVAGTAAVKQSAVEQNQLSGNTPSPTFASTTDYYDLLLGAVGNATLPGNVNPPSGWTRVQNAGQASCGLTVNVVNSHMNLTTVTFGSTSASNYADIVLELTIPPNTGVDASKLLGYTFPSQPAGADVTKLLAYALPSQPAGVDITKLVAYAVLAATNTNPPVWPTITPPYGYLTNPYVLGWDLTPAASPTTYSLVSGSLPPGLTLSSPSGDLGQISGTPTAVGTYSFTVRATNAYGTADEPMTISIFSPTGGGGGSFVFIG